MSTPTKSQFTEVNIDTLGDLFYPLFDRLFADNSDFVGNVETKLKQARMRETTEYYLSKGLGIGVVIGLILWVFGMALGYGIFAFNFITPETLSLGIPVPNEATAELLRSLVVPIIVILSGITFGTIGFAVGFGGYVGIPYQRASQRKRNINILLPDAISFMYALAVGGMNQLEILRAMAQTEETYDEVSKEFQSIINETEYLGEDYRNAIRTQALETPSDPFAQFLTDMLSIIDSGGDIESFLEDKKERHMRTAKQEEESTLDTLELFGEMYMTISMFPLLLLIILVVMGIMGQAREEMLYLVVYGMIPVIGVGFLVIIASAKKDDPGNGYLSVEPGETAEKKGVIDLSEIDQHTDSSSVFSFIKSQQRNYEIREIFASPHQFFKQYPTYTLLVTVPIALAVLGIGLVQGIAPTSLDGMMNQVVWGTLFWVYIPTYIILTPLAIFYEWNVRSRQTIIGKLSVNLRKIASANDTGQTLQEAIETVATTSTGNLARELSIIHAKISYGISVKQALIEFNNKYHIPRLSRTIKLIVEAQQATNEISDVLTTAARASENADDIERERRSRTQMQVAIILMTFLTLLGVMAILQSQFIDVMVELTQGNSGGGGAGSPVTGLDGGMLSMLFFHAVTLQALLAGFIAGIIRTGKPLSGTKFVVVLLTVSIAAWSVVA